MTVATRPAAARKRTTRAPKDRIDAAIEVVDESPQPFTVAHFRLWSATTKLDDGTYFVLDEFQASYLDDLFARTADGLPVYTECWLIVPEGNGKTTFVALLALYHAEFQPFAYVPVAASARDQAEIMYRQGEGFVLRTPHLHALVHSDIQAAKGKQKLDVPRFVCLEGYRRINHHAGSRIQVMASDDRTGDGVIPTLPIVDEGHRHKDLTLYRTWAGKLEKRRGAQIVLISTAGEPGSDFELTRTKIRQTATEVVRNGCHTIYRSPGVVMHEWAVPEDGDVTDMALVKQANPSPRITVESLAAKFAKPTMTMGHWKRLTCNLATRGSNAAITEDEWRKAEEEPIPEGIPVWLGLDVAWKWDTTSATPFWWRDADWRQFGYAEILVPPRDGSLLDPELVKDALRRIHDRNPIHTVVMDMAYAAELATWIADELGARVIDRSQTPAMAEQDYERFMEALGAGKLKHSGDPGLTAHAMHAVAKSTGNGDGTRFYRPAEGRQSAEQERRVIDALIAGAMVHSVAVGLHTQPVEPEVQPWVIVR